MLKLVHDAPARVDDEPITIGLDELCRLAAQDMLEVALLAERRAYLDAHADQTDATGKRLVVANGYAKQREVMTGAGMVEVKAPRVDGRREGEHYRSAVLPAYMRKSPKVTEGPAPALPTGPVHRGLCPRLGRALRFGDRSVGLDSAAAHRVLAG